MFVYSKLRDEICQLSDDASLGDEGFLDKCALICREFETARQLDRTTRLERDFLIASDLLCQKIIERAWNLLGELLHPVHGAPFDIVEAAYHRLLKEEVDMWFPFPVFLSFGDQVPCTYGWSCPYNIRFDPWKHFDGVVYLHLLTKGDLTTAYCNDCRSSDNVMAFEFAQEKLVSDFLVFAKAQSREGLNKHARKLLSGWLGQ